MNKQYIYADGVSRVTMLESMVRLDLFCCSQRDEQGKNKHEETAQLVLPPAAFLRAYEAMGEFVRRMEESGLVARKGTPSQAVPVQSHPQANISPNFE